LPKVRLYVAEVEGVIFVETPSSIRANNITEADLSEGFGELGQWWEVELNVPSFGLQEDAKRQALVNDPVTGFRQDEGKLIEARAALMVKEWPRWRWPDFASLPPNVANTLDGEIVIAMYPATANHPDFLEVLRRKLQSSQAEKKQQETSAIPPG
jgi:hypothetical protein